MMKYDEIITKLMCYTRNTYFVWKREKRPIITLLEKYYTKEELQEFLDTGKVSKYEKIEELLEIEKKYKNILEITKQG